MPSTRHSRRMEPVSWFDWRPDPERTYREHDPKLEPYTSMTKAQLLEAMMRARSGPEWDVLQEFYIDKCTEEELAVDRITFLRQQFGPQGEELFWFLSGVAGDATRVDPGHAGGNAPRKWGIR
jgi:hypothetical protein